MISNTVSAILKQTSPAELKHLENGCFDTARWLTNHLMPGLTDSQADCIAYRILESVNN